MERDEFDALVGRLTDVARAHPRRYLARVVGLLALAYGYLALVLLGALAVLVAVPIALFAFEAGGLAKPALVVIVGAAMLAWAILRGLWVKLEPPPGMPLARERAPELFRLLDELRAALRCAPFDRVQIGPDHNACVVQLPRLGILGWHRNYLLLGLPVLQGLAPDEFRAVLAHELAHSSRGHGRFGNWLYRLRRSWERIFEQMARQGRGGGFVLGRFVSWFWPRFNAHAFVLARADEYEADAGSVRLAGADAAARALLRLPVDTALLEHVFWPSVQERNNEEEDPPRDLFSDLGRALARGLPDDVGARHLRQALVLETDTTDTHPCLKDRLRAIGQLPAGIEQGRFPPAPRPPRPTAAEVYLGAEVEHVAHQLSLEWRESVETPWRQRFRHARDVKRELEAAGAAAPEDAGALWERARRLIDLEGDEAALPLLERVLALDPAHAPACFVLGRQRLTHDDAGGVPLLEKAIALEPALTPNAVGLLHAHFARTGQREKLRPLEERLDAFEERSRLATQERSNITVRDTLFAHELGPEALTQLRRIFAALPDVSAAAIARKQVQHFPTSPCYVIALRTGLPWWRLRLDSADLRLTRRVLEQVELSGSTQVFVARGARKPLAQKVFGVGGAPVYERAAP